MPAPRPDPVLPSLPRALLASPALPILWLAAGLVAGLGVAGAALGATPMGSEFQVNTYTTLRQGYGSAEVAVDADGGFVVVWCSGGSAGSDTDSYSIQGQRYDASGSAVGAEFQVNTYTTSRQRIPSVAVHADGEFMVVWESFGSSGSDTDGASVQGQRYDASGSAVGAEFQVNTYTTSTQTDPSAAVDADGDVVVVWRSNGSAGSDTDLYSIHGQRYDASGTAVGSEFQVNTYTTNMQSNSSVAVDTDGDFMVVWQSFGGSGSDASNWSIQGQRYDASGSAVGAQFQVNTYTTSGQYGPSVAVDAEGDVVVVWASNGSAGSDTADFSIQGQRYDASGSAVGSQFQVNTYTTDIQWSPSVAVDADGDVVVVWDSNGSPGSDTDLYSVQGQRYDASGTALGSQFQVNTYTTSTQRVPSVAVDPDGDFVVVWQSYGSSGSDTSSWSIQGQRYAVQVPRVPSLGTPGVIGLAMLLFGIAAVALRGTLGSRS